MLPASQLAPLLATKAMDAINTVIAPGRQLISCSSIATHPHQLSAASASATSGRLHAERHQVLPSVAELLQHAMDMPTNSNATDNINCGDWIQDIISKLEQAAKQQKELREAPSLEQARALASDTSKAVFIYPESAGADCTAGWAASPVCLASVDHQASPAGIRQEPPAAPSQVVLCIPQAAAPGPGIMLRVLMQRGSTVLQDVATAAQPGATSIRCDDPTSAVMLASWLALADRDPVAVPCPVLSLHGSCAKSIHLLKCCFCMSM
jgi:hypothetical protein